MVNSKRFRLFKSPQLTFAAAVQSLRCTLLFEALPQVAKLAVHHALRLACFALVRCLIPTKGVNVLLTSGKCFCLHLYHYRGSLSCYVGQSLPTLPPKRRLRHLVLHSSHFFSVFNNLKLKYFHSII